MDVMTIQVGRRREESQAVGPEHILLRVTAIAHQYHDVALGHVVGLPQRAIEKRAVIPVAFVVGQTVASSIDQQGIELSLLRPVGVGGAKQ